MSIADSFVHPHRTPQEPQTFDQLRRDTTFVKRLIWDELVLLWVHLLRIPSLIRKAVDVIKSEYWLDAGHPELAVLWTAAHQVLAESESLQFLPLRSKFLAIVKDASVDINERTIQDIVDDPRQNGPNRVGLLYHAYHGVAEGDIDYDYGAGLVKRFAKEFSVVNPLKKLLNDDQFRDNVPGNLPDIMARMQAASQRIDSMGDGVEKFTLASLRDAYPTLHLPVVEGLFREGETVNVVSYSKIGKSWFAYALALAIITGRRWLDRFETTPGKVILIDNELHRPTIPHRIVRVAEATELDAADYEQDLEIWPLRGRLKPLADLMPDFRAIQPGSVKAIVLDAKYRFAEQGKSENDNAAETLFYNLIDQIAEMTGAAIVMIHHSSKGSQSDKRVTDVGSGAGAQSRAADCHLVLREHETENIVVLEAAVRSFPPVEPLALRWESPCWRRDRNADTSRLRGRRTRNEERTAENDSVARDRIVEALNDGEPASMSEIRRRTGLSLGRADRIVCQLTAAREVVVRSTVRRGKAIDTYTFVGARPGSPGAGENDASQRRRMIRRRRSE